MTKTSEKLEDFDDISFYGIGVERREVLLTGGDECAVVWSTRDGWPIGIQHLYVWRDEHFWVTCTAARKRVR